MKQQDQEEKYVRPPPHNRAPRAFLRRRSLLAAAALAGCATPEEEPPRLVAPPQRAAEREVLPAPEPPRDLAALAHGADPVVAGQALDGALLRRFYARRGFARVWDDHAIQAEELRAAVLRAGDHGLDPARFGATLLPRLAQLPRVERELLLSHAVLSYAEALAQGAVPPARRKDGEALAPEPVDVTATLDAALDSRDPVSAIEALAPGTAGYLALRLALRRHRDAAPQTRATAERIRAIEVNLERHRWLPRRLPPDRVWVNVADQRLVLFRDDRPAFATRVVVGEEVPHRQSPEFHSAIDGAFLNPPWVIPADIVRGSLLPRLERDPDYLARRNIALRPDGEAEQAPGPDSALGAILFDMPNRFDVYLHDTPDRALFARDNRRASNGCIRVQNPLELAALVMDKPLDAIHEKIATGNTRREAVNRPMPVFLVYQTAFVSAERGLEFRQDFYGRDGAVWRNLRAPQARPHTGEPLEDGLETG